MTAEVALLNRRAVALAADSATTVTYWERGERRERYFKGTNKLFHLSTIHPIGLMTFDNGNLQGVPWEVLVKAYRDSSAGKPHDYAAGYAKDFFEYIETNTHIFPPDVQDKQLVSDVADTATRIVAMIAMNKKVKEESNQKTKRKSADALFKDLATKLKGTELIGSATDEMEQEIVSKFLEAIKTELSSRKYIADQLEIFDPDKLAKLAARAVLTKFMTTLDTTGIVVSGFGEKEYFPYLRVYTVYGIVLGKLLYATGAEETISQSNTSAIVPFAQSNMVRTFMYGATPGVLSDIDSLFTENMDWFGDELFKSGKLKAPVDEDVAKLKRSAADKFSDKLSDKLIETHTMPLRRVVGLLPIDELADLAEILISIESLKERVTRTTESVGGPIDVAVISKSDGFIWIKRKHYFDPGLNSRYFARKGTQNGRS